MDGWLAIVVRTMFAENLALAYLLGMCTFLAVSNRVATALGLGIAVIGVQSLTVPVNHLIYRYLLEAGALDWAGAAELDLTFLRFIIFVGVIAALVQILEMFLERFLPNLHHALGIYLPLLTVNCAILGGSLFMVQRDYDLGESVAYGFGSAAGWALAIILFAALRERLRYSDIPEGLRGLGLAFTVTGFLALGFAGLRGLGG